jgi:hypothetical protein
MKNAAPLEQLPPVEPAHSVGSLSHLAPLGARPTPSPGPGSHEQLMRAAVVAAMRAAATAAELRRTIDAERSARLSDVPE